MTKPFRGIFTIPATPFKEDLQVDWDGLRRVVEFCVGLRRARHRLAGQRQRVLRALGRGAPQGDGGRGRAGRRPRAGGDRHAGREHAPRRDVQPARQRRRRGRGDRHGALCPGHAGRGRHRGLLPGHLGRGGRARLYPEPHAGQRPLGQADGAHRAARSSTSSTSRKRPFR